MSRDQVLNITAEQDGKALASALKRLLPHLSWSQIKRAIIKRRVRVNGTLCLDPGRRLDQGDRIEIAEHSGRAVPSAADVGIVHHDEHLVVVDKPAGMLTIRRIEEQHWDERRKALQPTALEAVTRQLLQQHARRAPLVRPVHRLDRDTSGLMLFALSALAEQRLMRMFVRHEIQRTYLAVVHARLAQPRTIRTNIIRDRGDGLRGSLPADTPISADPSARTAITHVEPVQHIGYDLTLVRCRLETGRTHQIRIHLFELGHRLAGERLYTHARGELPRPDTSGAPRQALHSTDLKFVHPVTNAPMHFQSPLPRDLANWIERIRSS